MKALTVIASAWILTSLHAQEPATVRTIAPAPAKDATPYEVPGRTQPIESATIFTRATGIVQERRYEIGQLVKSGDVLAIISAPEIDRSVEAARANVEAVRARARNAFNLSERSSKLLKSSVVSAEETEQRQGVATEESAALRVAEAELARLEEQQRFSKVLAPFEGVISARNFDRGDHARGDSSGSDGWLYRLDRLDTLRFVVSATPDLALRLRQGDESTVRFAEFPGREFTALVAHSSRVFDTASGTMRVELLLENKDLELPAGLTGSARFQLRPAANSFIVPSNALLLREGKTLVATASDNKIRFLEVLPGRNFGRNVEISSERLNAETPLVLNPNAMLREGDAVSVAPAPKS